MADAHPIQAPVGHHRVGSDRPQSLLADGPVERVAANSRPSRHYRRGPNRFYFAVADGQPLALHARIYRQNTEHLERFPLERGKHAAERHQAAAFRVDWPAASNMLTQRSAHPLVGGDRMRVELGESATYVEALDVQRQSSIVEWRKRDDLSTSFGQKVNRVLVIKTKCAVVRDSDAHRLSHTSNCGR